MSLTWIELHPTDGTETSPYPPTGVFSPGIPTRDGSIVPSGSPIAMGVAYTRFYYRAYPTTGADGPIGGTASFTIPDPSYVDYGITFADKTDVRLATTANIALSGLVAIDGVAVASGDRVLVKNQTTGSQNGIYAASSGAWSRTTDADSDAEIASARVYVTSGTANGNTTWGMVTPSVVIGTTGQTWTRHIYPNLAQLDVSFTADGYNHSPYMTSPVVTSSATVFGSVSPSLTPDIGETPFAPGGVGQATLGGPILATDGGIWFYVDISSPGYYFPQIQQVDITGDPGPMLYGLPHDTSGDASPISEGFFGLWNGIVVSVSEVSPASIPLRSTANMNGSLFIPSQDAGNTTVWRFDEGAAPVSLCTLSGLTGANLMRHQGLLYLGANETTGGLATLYESDDEGENFTMLSAAFPSGYTAISWTEMLHGGFAAIGTNANNLYAVVSQDGTTWSDPLEIYDGGSDVPTGTIKQVTESGETHILVSDLTNYCIKNDDEFATAGTRLF